MDDMGLVGQYVAALGGGIVLVWATTEAIGKAINFPKIWLALLLGVAFAVVANGMQLLPQPEGVSAGWSYAFAVIMGLLATGGAKVANDQVADRFRR